MKISGSKKFGNIFIGDSTSNFLEPIQFYFENFLGLYTLYNYAKF